MSVFRRRSVLSLTVSGLFMGLVALLIAPHYEQVAQAARITLEELLNRIIVIEDQVLPEGGGAFADSVTVDGDLDVSGDIGSAGNAIVGGGVRVGSTSVPADPATAGMLRWNGAEGNLQVSDGVEWRNLEARGSSTMSGAVFRWAEWSSYDQSGGGWFANNNSAMFGGVPPQLWGDNGAIAANMSTNLDILGTLFIKTCRSGPNATVVADQWPINSSTNSKHAGALFRVRNTTGAAIAWNVSWYFTCYGSWGEYASVAVNGSSVFVDGGTRTAANNPVPVTLTIPANQTSTILFVSASGPPAGDVRACFLGFANNSLVLPIGLEYVDDVNELF